MPIVGVICGHDQTYQSFDTCIQCHEQGGQRNCDALVQVLKLMRDNHIKRQNAGWSASTLVSCARTVTLQERYDYYEDVKSGYNKARGEWVHSMIESDTTPRPGLIREERLIKYITINRKKYAVTGKPDEVDTLRGLLIDYKSKDALPKKSDPRHEAQFNVYAWLLDGGYHLNDDGTLGEQVHVTIVGGGMHYVTWKPKAPWLKMKYPLWGKTKTEAFIKTRLTPLIEAKTTGILPKCNEYVSYPRWPCDCVRLEEQLRERGVHINEVENT